jgi:shikimate kinase
MAKRSITRDVETIRQLLGARAIVLVGLMGAGKTSIGRRLAQRLGFAFVDADHEIETAAGKTIAEIFADHGETYFRDGEKRVIARLLDDGAQVLATGGGAYMNDETRKRISDKAVSVWLRADLNLLLKRVLKRNTRPLLASGNPEETMRKLVELRYPVYAEANVTVESRDVQHAQMTNEVIKSLAEWLTAEQAQNAN